MEQNNKMASLRALESEALLDQRWLSRVKLRLMQPCVTKTDGVRDAGFKKRSPTRPGTSL
jgi:hypothetical protein